MCNNAKFGGTGIKPIISKCGVILTSTYYVRKLFVGVQTQSGCVQTIDIMIRKETAKDNY